MQLFVEEKEIRSIKNVTLTSHRLWLESESSAHKQIQAIMLEDLCSCSLEYEAKPLWLWLAVAASAIGVLSSISYSRQYGSSGIIAGLVIGGIFYLLYLGSKTQYMQLASAAARINVRVQGDNVLPSKEFIEATLMAKNSRYVSPRSSDRMAQGV